MVKLGGYNFANMRDQWLITLNFSLGGFDTVWRNISHRRDRAWLVVLYGTMWIRVVRNWS